MIPELIQDWRKRLLEGTNKTLCAPGPRRKRAVTPQETDPDLPMSLQETVAEAWVNRGLLQGQGHNSVCTRPFEGGRHYLHSLLLSCPVMSNSLQPHGLHHIKLPCPSPTPGAHSNSCPSSWRRHPTISSSVIPFSSCLQSLPSLGSFPMSQFFTSGDQSIGVSASASVLPMNI